MEVLEAPPDLLESSDDEESETLRGIFPWGFKKTRNHSLQVSMWLQLEDCYRSDALHATMVKLMSPFLFLAQSELPAKWQDWSKTLHMFGLPKTTVNDPSRFEQGLYCCRMLFEAHYGMEKLSRKRNDLIALLEFVYRIDENKQSDLTRVINVARGQEQIKFLCDSMSNLSKQYSSPEIISPASSDAPHTSFERRVFAALLAGKQFAETIQKITFDGCDIVKQLNIKLAQSGRMLKFKDLGNDHYKKQKYNQAFTIYTEAINHFSFSSVLYCNRCITLMKLEQFKLAVADGYRATCLTPHWGKAYYRRAEALKMDGRLEWAIATTRFGLSMCDTKEKADLEKQLTISKDLAFEAMEKGKGENKSPTLKSNTRISLQEDPPALVSDDDSIKSLSDSEYSRAKKKMKKAEKRNAKGQVKSRDNLEKVSTKNERKENKSSDRGSQNGEVEGRKDQEFTKEKPQRKPHKQNSREDIRDKKTDDEKPRPAARITAQPPVEVKLFIGDVYQNHVATASRALLEKRFNVAANEYDAALKIITESKHKEWKITAVENFVVVYARGVSSLETQLPPEIARSLEFFSRIVKPSHKEYCHPMAFFACARAHYSLNNFSKVAPSIEGGMKLLAKKNFPGVLTYPGLSEAIPESDVITLKKMMEDIGKWSLNPPKPTVFCKYESCAKEYTRRGIYKNDLDFEGFIEVACDWDCVSCYHFKCWSKYKHAQFGRSGDKELLGLDCFTDGCGGVVCHIQMMDEYFLSKKKISVSKREIEKDISSLNKKRMPKSERNLERRKRLMREAKERKKSYKVAHNIYDAQDIEDKAKLESTKLNDVSHQSDVTNITVIKRGEEIQNEVAKTSKGKGKSKSKKKSSNVVSLQTFLGDDKYVNHDDAWRAVEKNQNSESPFQVPAEYRANVSEFETVITDEEQLKLSSVYSFFEDFYKRNGPLSIDDLLFRKEITREMLLLSDLRHPTFIEFLSSKTDTFCRVGNFIGLLSHREAMIQLCHKTNHRQFIKQNDKKVEPNKRQETSDFSKELWYIGDVPLTEVQNMLGVNTKSGTSAPTKPVGQVVPVTNVKFSNLVTLEQNTNKPVAVLDTNKNIKKPEVGDGDKKKGQSVNNKAFKSQKKEAEKSQSITKSTPGRNEPKVNKTKTNNSVQSNGKSPTLSLISSPTPPVRCDTAVQTELITSYENQIQVLLLEKSLLREGNEELNDKLTHLANTSRTEVALLSKDMSELKDRCNTAEHQLTMAKLNAESEAKKVAREKATLIESVKTAKKQQKEAEDSELELKEILANKQKEIENLTHAMQSDRDNWLKNKYDSAEELKKMEAKLKECSERLIAAETVTLRTRENFATKTLVVAKLESEKFSKEFEQLAIKYMNSPLIKSKVVEACMRWKKNSDECYIKLETTHKLYNDQIQEIMRGKKLSELPNIVVPNPPPPGPNFHQVQAAIRSIPFGMPPKIGMPLPHPNDQTSHAMSMANNHAELYRNAVNPVAPQMSNPSLVMPPEGPWLNQPTNGRESLTSTPNSHPPSPGPITPSSSQIATTIAAVELNQTPVIQNHQAALQRPQPIQPPYQTTPAPPQPPQPPPQTQPVAPRHKSPAPETSQPATRPQAAPQHKGSFERIMDQLRKLYPNVPRNEIAQCIKEVRQNNNNSLTGLSLEDIVKQATVVINKRMSKKVGQVAPFNSTSSRPTNMPSVAPWVQSKQQQPKTTKLRETNEDEPCVICHDPLTSSETHKLLCGHVFHSECLNKWLTRNRTCPTCRDYAIDTSEYPTLKSTFRF